MVDMHKEEMAIRWRTSAALGVTLIAFALAYFILPLFHLFPFQTSHRFALAAQSSAFILIWLLIGIGMVSFGRRQSPEDIGGAAAGPPSDRLAIKVAFLHNTLEQSVLACGAFFAYAAIMDGDALALIPVSVILFGIGRYLFYKGYPHGAGARAFGMGLTLLPGALLLIAAMAGTFWGLYVEHWAR